MKSHPLLYELNEIQQKLHFALKLSRLCNDAQFCHDYPNFASDLESSTRKTLLCAGMAAYQLIMEEALTASAQSSFKEIQRKLAFLPIRARVFGYTPIVKVPNLRQDCGPPWRSG